MSDLAQLSARIADHFHGAFGRTPLAERVQDILLVSLELIRTRRRLVRAQADANGVRKQKPTASKG
jgi:hypothetical protein